ncbi:phosphate acetyltransferase [Bifidobacterium choloepi]|uniref:phosphate acetyltransferase n=1 Tax=Bifidobacterium choloepi TaxID=2614131 RepID=UPI002F2B2BEE
MSRINVSIISPEAGNGRNAVAVGIVSALSKREKTGVFRPAVTKDEGLTSVLLDLASAEETRDQATGVTPRESRTDPGDARAAIVAKFTETEAAVKPEAMVIVGSDKSSVGDPERFAFNARVSADLQSPVLLTVCTIDRTPDEVAQTIESCEKVIVNAGTKVIGVFVTGCRGDDADNLRKYFDGYRLPVWTIPFVDFGKEGAVEHAEQAFCENVDSAQFFAALDEPFVKPTTPFAFQYSLLEKAKRDRKTIVLPEGCDDRILKSADYLLKREIVDLIIIGEQDEILARGKELGLDSLDKAHFQSMDDEAMLQPMIAKLCELRAKKGMTPEKAAATLKDMSYFGTMLVVMGYADGLVSGAINSTANTVRPALQVIKTKPDATSVSGAFLMCFKDHVAVFADCAINTNPDASEIANIAIQSAETAKSFDIDPKIGMLSYSTINSGKGPDVDIVVEATKLVAERRPDLPVVGPVQFDAAWSPTVAAVKAPGNDVAGHVNVFVFPDLTAGNICYKAVQRSSGAVAIGPILQGLNKPVNDLSRGALVQDIINTIALTAIEAQQD